MMVTISVTINAPIEEVWAVLTDESKIPIWSAAAPRLSYPEGRRRADPTGQEFILTFPGRGKNVEQRCMYVSFLPPRLLSARAYCGTGTMLSSYVLQPDGQRTALSLTVEPEGSLTPLPFLAYLSRPLYQFMSRGALKRLKRLIEEPRRQTG